MVRVMAVLAATAVAALLTAGCAGLDAGAHSHDHGHHHDHGHDHDHDHRHDHHDEVSAQGVFEIDRRDFSAAPYSHLDFKNDPADFQFVIVSDRTGGHRTGVFRSAIEKVNLLQPEFVVSVGDLIEGYTADPDVLADQWDEFNAIIDTLEAPFFYTPGNHDYTNDVMADLWAAQYGPSYYHFIYKDVLFLILNTEEALTGGAKPSLSDAQLAYARKALAENQDARWTLVFMHQPLWDFDNTPNWDALEAELGERDYTAFAGHMHTYDLDQAPNGAADHITLGSTGGITLGRGEAYGEFDHVTWITMREDGPVIANLALDGIFDKFVTAPGFEESFGSDAAVSFSPWYVDRAPRAGEVAIAEVTIDNPFSGEMAYQLIVPSHPGVALRAHAPAGVLAPGESRTERLELRMLADWRDDLSAPLTVHAEAEVTFSASNKVDWTKTARLAPVRKETLARAAQPVIFDGDVSEWPAMRFNKAGASAADGSFRFDTAYDDAFLYVAVDVVDDEVTHSKPIGLDMTVDAAAIAFDARPAALSAGNIGRTVDLKHGEWMFLMVAPDGEEGTVPFRSLIPEMFQVRYQPTAKGYSAEFAIPVGYLDFQYGGAWRDLRLAVSINDADPAKGEATEAISWRPNWNEGVVGSGLFERR